LFFFIVWPAGRLIAAEPSLRNLDIRGLRVGGTATLTIDGDDLGKAPKLLLPFPAKQTLKAGATDKKAAFDVELAGDVEPGYYQLRVVAEGGVSLPVLIAVDRLVQQNATEPIKELPAALHGNVAGAAIVEAKFAGKAKQRVMIEVESQRLGAKLRPVVHLYSPKKLQVDWAWGAPALLGDTRLEAILPEDGAYTVTLHDAEYAAAAPSFFRLKIGEWSHVDQVYPPIVTKNQTWTVSLLGAKDPVQMSVNTVSATEFLRLPWPKGDTWSGPRPFVSISPHAEHMEAPKSDKLQEIPAGPAGITGKLSAPNEEDRYRVAVAPGKKVKLEVFAERIGSPIDVAVVVRNDKGDQLARGEDSPGTLDPVLEYSVPDKVTSIIVGVVDAQGRGGPRGVYRLVIDPLTQGALGGGFKLSTTAQRISAPIGGYAIVPVQIERRGYMGPIRLFADPPIPGFKTDIGEIPEGADGALVAFEVDKIEPMRLGLNGRAGGGDPVLVGIKNHPMARLQPWLATELSLSSSDQQAKEFNIDWRDLPEKTVIVPGSRLLLPVKLVRPMTKTTVKLTLVTSQNTPIVNNQPDPNKALRQDKTGELAANVASGDVTMLTPVELSAPVYDVTVQAELLDPAKKVLATAYAPVRRMPVVLPIALQLDGPTRIEVPYDAKKGATLKLAGKVERREGLKADVVLALTGLPAGAKADAVNVKADASDFLINITIPPGMATGEFSGIKLSGSFAPDAKTPNVRVRSREIELTLALK
jgi:hypothetical protein